MSCKLNEIYIMVEILAHTCLQNYIQTKWKQMHYETNKHVIT